MKWVTRERPKTGRIAEGFYLLELDDHDQLERSLPVYDALHAPKVLAARRRALPVDAAAQRRNEVAAGRAGI
jgi:hypothetical protein